VLSKNIYDIVYEPRGQNDAVQCVNILKVRNNQHGCSAIRTPKYVQCNNSKRVRCVNSGRHFLLPRHVGTCFIVLNQTCNYWPSVVSSCKRSNVLETFTSCAIEQT
jgi:hypothetical protein